MENNRKPISIKSRQDFLNLRVSGQKIVSKNGILFIFVKSQSTQFSWTISKKIGNAVLRNKLKRYCRESVRKNHQKLLKYNLLINVIFPYRSKSRFNKLCYQDVEKAVHEFIKIYEKNYC